MATFGGAWAAEWPDMVGWQEHDRKYGVEQFIRLYNKLKVIDGLFTYTINALQCCSVGAFIFMFAE